MAIKIKQKSPLDDFLGNVGTGFSNLASNVQKTFTPAVNTAQSYVDNFSKGYQNYQKQQQAQEAQRRQQTFNLAKTLIPTAQKTAASLFDNFKNYQIQANKNHANSVPLTPFVAKGVPTLRVPVPKPLQEPVTELKVGIQNLKAAVPIGAAAILDEANKFARNQNLIGLGGPVGQGDFIPGIKTNIKYGELVPKGALPSEWLKGEALKRGKAEIAEGQKIGKDLPKQEDKGTLGNITDPAHLRRMFLMNAPGFVAGLGISGAVAAITKNPQLAYLTAYATAFPQNAQDIFADAKANGATDDDALNVAKFGSAAISVLDVFGAEKILNRFAVGPEIRRGLVRDIMLGFTRNALQEGSTESVQQVIQNAIAKVNYAPARNLLSGALESFIIGGGFGGGAGAITNAVTNQVPPISSQDEGVLTPPNDEIGPLNQPNPEPPVNENPPPTEDVLGTSAPEESQTTDLTTLPQTLQQQVEYLRSQNVSKQEFMDNLKNDLTKGTDEQKKFAKDTIIEIANLEKTPESFYDEFVPIEIKPADINPEADAAKLIQEDLQQALTDTGDQLVEGKGTNTTPSLPEAFNMTVEEAQGAIGGLFSENEIKFLTDATGKLTTPEGEVAHGKYYDSVVQVMEQGGKVESKTVYHEAFHAFADKFVDKELYESALADVMATGKMSQEQANEKLAEGFASYMQGNTSFSDKIKAFFTTFIAKFRELIGKYDSAQQIYEQIKSGQRPVDARESGVSEENAQFRTVPEEFVPSEEWQVVPEGMAVPPGGEYNLNPETGQTMARWPKNIQQQNERVVNEENSDNVTNPEDPFYNLEKMNIPNDAKKVIKDQVVGDLQEEIKQRVGKPLTDEEVIKAAQLSSDEIIRSIGREETTKFAAAQLRLRQGVAEMADKVAAGEPVTKEFLEKIIADKTFAENTARLMQKRGISIEPNSPASDLMLKMMKEILEVTDDLDGVIKASANVDWTNRGEVTKFYRQYVRPSVGDWVDKLRYGSMLSSVNTHIINMASNWEGSMILTPINKFNEGIIDALASAATLGKRERTRFATEGLVYAKAAYTVGMKRAWKGMINALSGQVVDPNPDINMTPLITGGVGKVIETALDVPGRALEAEDQFFIEMTKAGLEAAYQHRQNRGVKVKTLPNTVKDETNRILFRADLSRRGEGALADALLAGAQHVQQWTYSKNNIVRWMSKLSFPFVRVGTNIAAEGIQGTPGLSAINMIGKQDKIEGVNRMIMGSGVTMVAAALASAGKMHAWEPTDPKKRAAFKEAGYLPWSVVLPTPWGEQSVQFNKLHPVFGVQLGLVAAVMQGLEDKKLDEDTAVKVLSAFAGFTKYFADQTYFKNMQDFSSTLSGDPLAISQLISNYPSQFIPYRAFGGWVTRLIDEYQRAPKPDANMVEKVIQNIQAGIPFASTYVPAREGVGGVPLKNKNNVFNSFSPYKTSPINKEGEQYYGQLVKRSEQNKLIRMQNEKEKEGEDALNPMSATDKAAKEKSDVQEEILTNDLKLGKKDSIYINNKYKYFDETTGEVKTIDLNKFKKEATGIDKYKQDEEKYSTARSIFESGLKDKDKAAAYKKLGVKSDQVEYDYYSTQTNEIKTNYLIDYFGDKNHDEVLNTLINGRLDSISGAQLASDTVINNLEDEGIISADEAKYLKGIKYNSKGELIGSGGSGKKVNLKFSDISFKKPGSSKVKLNGPSKASGGSISVPKLKILNTRAPKLGSYNGNGGASFSPANIKLNLRTPVFNISGLGK